MEDLQGSLSTGDADPDEGIPESTDAEVLQEYTKGDEAFVEQLQESLRPL
jgi:hypothetical protein